MKPFLGGDEKLAAEVARHLALWMAYEDIIRVADLKTRASRFERVRKEVGAKDGEPVVVIDYLKPGVEEFASRAAPRPRQATHPWAERRGKLDAYNVGMHIRTSGLLGYLLVRSLAWLRPWRPLSYRYREEQQLIERWLALVRRGGAPRRRARPRGRRMRPPDQGLRRDPPPRQGATSSPSSTRWSRTRRRPTRASRRRRSARRARRRSPTPRARRSARRSASP